MSPKSERGRLRADIGALHLKILKLKRGDICEIHNRKCGVIGRMHILPVGRYPRLEFTEINVILTSWFCSHFYTHHDFRDKRAQFTEKRILELRGHKTREDLETELKILHKTMPRHDIGYLKLLKIAFQQELNELKERL